MANATEVWKVFRNTSYEASNLGNIRNKNGRILRPQDASNNKGYQQVRIFDGMDKKGTLFYVHRIVYEVFKGKIPDGYEINHINCNTKDNKLENLEVVTHRQNIAAYYLQGHAFKSGKSKITADLVYKIRYDWIDNSAQAVAERIGVNPHTIYRIRRRETWDFVH